MPMLNLPHSTTHPTSGQARRSPLLCCLTQAPEGVITADVLDSAVKMRLAATFFFLAAAAAISMLNGTAASEQLDSQAQQVVDQADQALNRKKPSRRTVVSKSKEGIGSVETSGDLEASRPAERREPVPHTTNYSPQSVGYYVQRRAMKRKHRRLLESEEKRLQRSNGSTAGSGEQ
ncbi:hypothetical protein Efla_003111 [Eimeria flavescens]